MAGTTDEQSEENPGKEYLTLKQCNAEGGTVKKGEKSKFVVFWKMQELKKDDSKLSDEERQLIADGYEQLVKYRPVLRYYHVFEVGQCECISRKYPIEERPQLDPVDGAEHIVNEYFDRETCKLQVHESDKAYYYPSLDIVCVPRMSQYDVAAEYYSTLFHEMTHSTGHSSRLNRFNNDSAHFGSTAYSKEELVAELGSAFLLNKAGIDCKKAFTNSVAYIQGWSRKLREDKNLFVSAASKAEAAVNFITGGKL